MLPVEVGFESRHFFLAARHGSAQLLGRRRARGRDCKNQRSAKRNRRNIERFQRLF